MCVAILQKPNKKVSKSNMDSFAISNKDGFGILYITKDNKLKSYRNLKYPDFIKAYDVICEKYGNKPMAIHFRLGTSGRKDIPNCHPFFVNDHIGFIHNGVIYKPEVGTDTEKSDTNLLNRKIVKSLGDNIFDNEETRLLFTDYVGGGNKFIFLNANEQYVIINEDEGIWEDDIWYSNKWALRKNEVVGVNRIYHSSSYNNFCSICNEEVNFGSDYITIYKRKGFSKYVCERCIQLDPKLSDILN